MLEENEVEIIRVMADRNDEQKSTIQREGIPSMILTRERGKPGKLEVETDDD